MEAEGIEPSSRDDDAVGLYMLSRSFDLDADGEDRHSPPTSRRLNLAGQPTSELLGQLAFRGPERRKHPSCAQTACNQAAIA